MLDRNACIFARNPPTKTIMNPRNLPTAHLREVIIMGRLDDFLTNYAGLFAKKYIDYKIPEERHWYFRTYPSPIMPSRYVALEYDVPYTNVL
jgi:hypothetical protein